MNHMYYYDPEVIDLNAMRMDAKSRLQTNVHKSSPSETIIHHHRHGAPCEGSTHEEYLVQEATK